MRHLFAVGIVLVSCAAALSKAVAPPPSIPARAAASDAVIVGTVTSIEESTVKAAPYPGATEKIEFTVAVVKVEQNLHGAKGTTHIKVGMPAGGGRRAVSLTKGEEVCLFLRNTDESFYVARDFSCKIDPKAGTFKTQLEEIKKASEVIDKPLEALKAKDAGDRYNAAAILLQHYRPRETDLAKTKALDAEESKLILTALAEADWNNFKGDYLLSPQAVFGQLGLSEKDGWGLKPNEGLEAGAKRWLKDNAGKYRIQRQAPAEERK